MLVRSPILLLNVSDDEATILDEIERKLKEKRPAVKESPVRPGQPRKAAVNQKKLMADLKVGSKSAASQKLESKRQKVTYCENLANKTRAL